MFVVECKLLNLTKQQRLVLVKNVLVDFLLAYAKVFKIRFV